jgi:hypothetical protein
MSDEYSPETPKRERNGGFRAMSTSTHSSTVSEDSLYAILSRLHVDYLAKEPVAIWGEYWPNYGGVVKLIPDALIVGKDYEAGVIEVDGSAHKTRGAARWDAKKNLYYEKMHLWVERIQNREVNQANVEAILSRHKRQQVEFP